MRRSDITSLKQRHHGLACLAHSPSEDSALGLLLAAVRVTPGPLPEVPVDFRWERVLTLANRHAVLPLLFRFLVNGTDLAVPPAILDRLRHHVFAVGRLSLERAGELVRLVGALEAAGVRVMPYKGPTLALQAYGDLSSRQFDDLDFLVPPADLDRALAVVQSHGYELYPKLTPARKRSFYASECECWLANADETLNVEIHWSVRERLFGINQDLAGMAARCTPLRLAGGSVPGLSAEDLLVVLAIHGIKHAWHRLKWIRDVAGVVARHPRLEWETVFREAQKLRAERLLVLPLLLCELLLGMPLPDAVTARVQSPEWALAIDVANLVLASGGEEPTARQRHAISLRARESLRDRLQYMAELAFTPTIADWEAVPLPDALFPLYHLIRPVRLLSGSGNRLE